MRATAQLSLLTLLLLASLPGAAASTACLGCHDFGPDSPVHPMLESQHGNAGEGCASCHGASTDHMSRPTIDAPDTSYGPRWTTSTAQQDAQCLECHRDGVAAHWEDALHMVNNLNCAACHDVHAKEDLVLDPGSQHEVCTTCHKTQKSGIHGRERMRKMNPPCTTCHNPHADSRPRPTMLANDSAGCRKCHKLSSMANSAKVSEKAKSYHRVMLREEGDARPIRHTCAQCHEGAAHGDTDAVEPFNALAVSQRDVTLFYPGQSDHEWIRSRHPGSQPFRQGSNCQQCHRGEEAGMGAALVGDGGQGSMSLNARFRVDGPDLVLEVSWKGAADDEDIALMWGYGVNDEFRRGGCWAACHEDMPAMSRDRGAGPGKYLADSRSQIDNVGRPSITRPAEELERFIAAGNFVEMWRLDLQAGGKPATAVLLEQLRWMDQPAISAGASYAGGEWTATIKRPLQPAAPLKAIEPGRRYTFGMAIHAEGRQKSKHWVSLPMTFSLDRSDTDFRAD